MKQARDSAGNQQPKDVYEMDQDEGAAPEKVRDQEERLTLEKLPPMHPSSIPPLIN